MCCCGVVAAPRHCVEQLPAAQQQLGVLILPPPVLRGESRCVCCAAAAWPQRLTDAPCVQQCVMRLLLLLLQHAAVCTMPPVVHPCSSLSSVFVSGGSGAYSPTACHEWFGLPRQAAPERRKTDASMHVLPASRVRCFTGWWVYVGHRGFCVRERVGVCFGVSCVWGLYVCV